MQQNQQFINGLMVELRKNGYDCKLNEIEIDISQNGVPVMSLRTNGDYKIHEGAINDCNFEIRTMFQTLKEAYDLYFSGAPLEYDKLSRYHKYNDFNDYILAARLNSDDSLEFVTWQKTHDKTALTIGHYFNNYERAKEDFALRCGLVDRRKMFNETEMKLIHQGLVFLGTDYPKLTAEQMTTMGKVIERIEMIIPSIIEHEQFEENDLVADDELRL